MNEQIYAQERRRLTDAFEQGQAQRDARWVAEQTELDAERGRLAADRERANRSVYVRQEQAKARLPEELNRLGINGGAAETNLLRMNQTFHTERAQNERTYQDAVRQVNQTAEKQRAAIQKEAETAEQRYYDRMTALAQELAEAQQAAAEKRAQAEEARAWEREKYQMQVNAALQKAQIAANLAREKAQIAAAAKSDSEKSAGRTKTTSGTKQSAGQAKKTVSQSAQGTSGVRYLTVPTGSGMQRLTQLDGRTYANPVQFDGSGTAKIQVGDKFYTVAELQTALRDGTVVAQSGPMNSSRYVAAVRGVEKSQ